MRRSLIVIALLLTAIAGVVVGTRERDVSEKKQFILVSETTMLRARLEGLERQRSNIAQRPTPFLGCPSANPTQPAVACYECIGLLGNIAMDTDEETEKLGEIDGRRWHCRSASAVDHRLATQKQDLAVAEIELTDARRRLTRGNLLIASGFALALAALARALFRK